MELFESELHVMNLLWDRGDLTAKEIAAFLAESIGWNKNTTYTVIKKCVNKGYIERCGRNYLCHALIQRKEAQKGAVQGVVNRLFGGSEVGLITSLLGDGTLSETELNEIERMINNKNEVNNKK